MKFTVVRVLALLGLALVVSAGGLVAYVAAQPNDFVVTRSRVMAAPPEAIFAEVNDFHRWDHWSPWAKLDPSAKNEFSGPESGVGAVFRWSGNDQVGVGSMTIVESEAPRRVRMKLAFTQPMQDESDTGFLLEPQGDQTKVTWDMRGRHANLIGKCFCYCLGMEGMIGAKYEEGLTNIQKLVEGQPAASAP